MLWEGGVGCSIKAGGVPCSTPSVQCSAGVGCSIKAGGVPCSTRIPTLHHQAVMVRRHHDSRATRLFFKAVPLHKAEFVFMMEVCNHHL